MIIESQCRICQNSLVARVDGRSRLIQQVVLMKTQIKLPFVIRVKTKVQCSCSRFISALGSYLQVTIIDVSVSDTACGCEKVVTVKLDVPVLPAGG